MEHVRAQMHFVTTKQATDFVTTLNSNGFTDNFSLENFKGNIRVDAKSLLGVIYMMTEFPDQTYLVNDNDGDIPAILNEYRA